MTFKSAVPAVAIAIFIAGTPPDASATEPDYTRTPVLMVHGYFPSGAAEWVTWGTFRNKLIDDGWPEEYVYAPQFKDTTGCDPDHAREISAWVDELRTATGVDRINIVAHSEGGLNTMYYLRYFCGVHKVKNFVGLAIAVHGTIVACVDPFSCGADEMCIDMGDDGWRSNPGLVAVNECDETIGDILYTSIWSETDEIIRPPSGSKLAGARNIELDGIVGHGTIFLFDQSFNHMKDALLNGTGLNTDGPGWNCIDYCVAPDLPDTAEQTETVELTEAVESQDDDTATAELPSDTMEPGDASSDLAVAEPIPADEGGTGTDAVTSDDVNAGRDAQSVTDVASDGAILDARTSDTNDTGSISHSGGCGASSGNATPVAVVIFSFMAVLFARARRRC